MTKLNRHIAKLLILIFVYPDVSASIHYLLYHRVNDFHETSNGIYVLSKDSIVCPFENVKYAPFQPIELVYVRYFIKFLTAIQIKTNISYPNLKEFYSFDLRAPPGQIAKTYIAIIK